LRVKFGTNGVLEATLESSLRADDGIRLNGSKCVLLTSSGASWMLIGFKLIKVRR
jgi:hypothetical protein